MEKKEMTMEVRLLIAFVLVGLVLFVDSYFVKPPGPPPAGESKQPIATATTNSDSKAEPKAGAIPVPAAAPQSAAPMPGAIEAPKEDIFAIDTDYYHVEFTNLGGVVHRWQLKKYRNHDFTSKQPVPVELVNVQALAKVPAPFSLAFNKDQHPSSDANTRLFKADQPDDLTVNFEFSDGQMDVKKSFHFTKDSYLVNISSSVTQNGAGMPHELSWRGGFGDETENSAVTNQHALYYDSPNSKLNVKQVKEAKDGPVSWAGHFSFAGLEDHYFAGVFLPEGSGLVDLTAFSDTLPDTAGKDQPRIGASVGGDGNNTFTFFAGPKDYNLLGKINPKLEALIDWSWIGVNLGFLGKPLFIMLSWTADNLTHNYGWAIVFLTIGITIVLFPLRLTQLRSARKMQAIQPLIKQLNDKYKNLPLKDPRQTEKNQEMMDLYKQYGINPVGGCFPMLIQLPILVAFYKVLGVMIELRGANWLWIHDLSAPETLAIRVLPLALIASQFLQTKMTPQPGVDAAQQRMMTVLMPLMMGYIFYFLSSGLVLYYLTSNLVGIAQQLILNRATPAPAPVEVKPASKKKART